MSKLLAVFMAALLLSFAAHAEQKGDVFSMVVCRSESGVRQVLAQFEKSPDSVLLIVGKHDCGLMTMSRAMRGRHVYTLSTQARDGTLSHKIYKLKGAPHNFIFGVARGQSELKAQPRLAVQEKKSR